MSNRGPIFSVKEYSTANTYGISFSLYQFNSRDKNAIYNLLTRTDNYNDKYLGNYSSNAIGVFRYLGMKTDAKSNVLKKDLPRMIRNGNQIINLGELSRSDYYLRYIFLNDTNQMNNIYKFNDDTVNDINDIKSMFENMETMNWAFCLGLLQFINKIYGINPFKKNNPTIKDDIYEQYIRGKIEKKGSSSSSSSSNINDNYNLQSYQNDRPNNNNNNQKNIGSSMFGRQENPKKENNRYK